YAKFILATTEKHKIIPTILSRCQIFDFKRITVDDIAKHLAWVAQSENVNAEPEALHIIAQKADGALRDALSMFDQMVSLGNQTITYQLVIDNLNVLDYEYYFRMTDYMLTGNIQNALLLFNEIIEKGFEGQHFITGLGDHFRNLMMCRDSSTAKLIETSESIRNRYLSQTKQCPLDFIINALDINNKCDINYRTSNNKRLLIEVTLIRLCQLSVIKPAAPAAPAQAEIPVVSKEEPVTTKAAEQPAPEIIKTEPEPAKAEEPAAQLVTSVKEQPQQVTEIKTTPNPEPQTAEIPALASTKPAQARAMGPVSLSIKSAISQAQSDQKKAESDGKRNSPFTQDQLSDAWNKFAASIKESSTLLYAALSGHEPTLGEEGTIHLELENRVLEAEFNRNKSDLFIFLKDTLSNDLLNVETTVKEQVEETRKPYSDKDKYEQMIEKAPLIKTLKDQLDLGLDG
ncbi:MAG TPA: DNA polymerase III subunit gamma/tau, partial [Bacteroidales bacterium]|nr:DNA polymerase III subunit gamma/tau [Bacteroidales bacterium]